MRGFSLVELMVVVVIIAIVSALALPSMATAMRERRTQQAAISVLDIFRQVRTRAMFRGTSQVVVVRPSGSALIIEAWEGNSSSCRRSVFGTVTTDMGTGLSTGSLSTVTRLVQLDLTAGKYSRDGIQATVTLPTTAVGGFQLCYTPTGNAFFSLTTTGADPTSLTLSNDSTTTGTGGAFQIEVFQGTGAHRRVVVPLGGVPRMRTS